MQRVKDYLSNPTTWISFGIFIFWLGGLYATTNNRIAELEKKYNEMDMVKIQTTLSQIQTDIEWIKKTLVK
jgi:hypothetical protein